jgi:hypothetical protein
VVENNPPNKQEKQVFLSSINSYLGIMNVDSASNPPKPREEFIIKQKAA